MPQEYTTIDREQLEEKMLEELPVSRAAIRERTSRARGRMRPSVDAGESTQEVRP